MERLGEKNFVRRNKLNILATSVAAVSTAAAAVAVEKPASFNPLTSSADSASQLVLNNPHEAYDKAYEQLRAMLPGAENAEAQTPPPAYAKAKQNIAGPVPAKSKDAEGWPLKLYKDSGCEPSKLMSAQPLRETTIGKGEATYRVEPGKQFSLYRDPPGPTQTNFTAGGECLAFTAGDAGTLTEITFDDILKWSDFAKSTYMAIQASAEFRNLYMGKLPPNWAVAATVIHDALALVIDQPEVFATIGMVSYPEGCKGPAIYNIPGLDQTLTYNGQRIEQTINIQISDVTCTIDPTGKPVTFSTVFGGKDNAGNPMQGLVVEQSTGIVSNSVGVGGTAESPNLTELPENTTSQKNKDKTMPIVAGVVVAIGAITATGVAFHINRSRSS